MFSNLKDLYQFQSQAKELQKKLANEIITVEKQGIQITMSGNQEVLSITVNTELSKTEQEKFLGELFNEAVKKIQQLMANKMISL